MKRKIAFNCRTLEDAQDFIYQCVKRDVHVGRCANWDIYKENTCFEIEDNRVWYSNKDYYSADGYEIITYEKGDNIFGGNLEKLKGNGQCRCAKCGIIEWTDWCYRLYDKTSEYHGKILCSDCANEFKK